MKICRMMLYSDYISDDMLFRSLSNSESHVDTCYLCIYENNWRHEPHKKLNYLLLNQLKNKFKNLKILNLKEEDVDGKKTDKPNIIETKFRNKILEIAKEEGNDFLYIQDTDEFILPQDYEWIRNSYLPLMRINNFSFCSMKWVNFWKSWDYVLVNSDGNYYQSEKDIFAGIENHSRLTFWRAFAVDLTKNVTFEDSSHIDEKKHAKSWIFEDRFMYHGSYVLTDEEVKQKIQTWTHSCDMDYTEWYDEKWLKWNPETTDLHPSSNPWIWKKAVPYKGTLPKECT